MPALDDDREEALAQKQFAWAYYGRNLSAQEYEGVRASVRDYLISLIPKPILRTQTKRAKQRFAGKMRAYNRYVRLIAP